MSQPTTSEKPTLEERLAALEAQQAQIIKALRGIHGEFRAATDACNGKRYRFSDDEKDGLVTLTRLAAGRSHGR